MMPNLPEKELSADNVHVTDEDYVLQLVSKYRLKNLINKFINYFELFDNNILFASMTSKLLLWLFHCF